MSENTSETGPDRRRTALVTGAGIRLGRVLALACAELGFDVAVHYNSSAAPAEQTAQTIAAQHGRRAELFQADFGQTDFDADALVGEVSSRMPALSLLVNSASVYEAATIRQTSRDLLQRQMQVNLFAPLALMRAFARVGTARDVINILDNKIDFHQFQYAAYLLSKKSLADLTAMAALELAPDIRVNGIAPGVILPAESRSPEYLEWRKTGIPLQKRGHPEQVAHALQYLLENKFTTGRILYVDGGESLDNTGRNAENFGNSADRTPPA